MTPPAQMARQLRFYSCTFHSFFSSLESCFANHSQKHPHYSQLLFRDTVVDGPETGSLRYSFDWVDFLLNELYNDRFTDDLGKLHGGEFCTIILDTICAWRFKVRIVRVYIMNIMTSGRKNAASEPLDLKFRHVYSAHVANKQIISINSAKNRDWNGDTYKTG